MNRYLAAYDLHLHTYYSYDACAAPAYYFELASQLGLRAIAVTDHHNFDVLPELRETARRFPDVGFFTGAELTCSTPWGDMDFVCLGLPWEPTESLRRLQDTLHRYQWDMGDGFSAIAARLGGEYTREERRKLLLGYRPERVVELQGITHVRNEIQMDYWISKGFAASREAIREALNGPATHYRDLLPSPPGADEVSKIVHEAGGVMLIAHPTAYFLGKNLTRIEAVREFSNFDGVECAHPGTAPENGRFWRSYCERNKLLSSGGTDMHSDAAREALQLSPDRSFAEHLGDERWLDELCERVPLYYGRDL